MDNRLYSKNQDSVRGLEKLYCTTHRTGFYGDCRICIQLTIVELLTKFLQLFQPVKILVDEASEEE